MGSRDRITIPVKGFATGARDGDGKLSSARGDVGSVVPVHAVPWLMVTHEELRRLPLDSRAGFVVSLIDGCVTVETILDMAGLPEREVLELLGTLRDLGAVELREPRSRGRGG